MKRVKMVIVALIVVAVSAGSIVAHSALQITSTGGQETSVIRGVGRTGLWVVEAYWSVDSTRVQSVIIGTAVEAHVKVQNSKAPASGTLTVKVRGDMAGAPDFDYAVYSFSVSLKPDEHREYFVVFTPSEPSGGTFGYPFQGYYITVDFNGESVYAMEPTYPPSLRTTKP